MISFLRSVDPEHGFLVFDWFVVEQDPAGSITPLVYQFAFQVQDGFRLLYDDAVHVTFR